MNSKKEMVAAATTEEKIIAAKNAPILAEELEVRIDSYSDKSYTVVVYWNPRVAMAKLTQKYGDNWSKSIKLLDKKSAETPFYAVCSIKAVDENGTEIIREDVGEDDISPKNASSDALKRAAMNFIPAAQALYTIPTLRIPVSKLGLSVSGKANVKEAVKFKRHFVQSITFAEGASGVFVKAIQIAEEETGNVVCEYTSKRTAITTKASANLLELKAQMAIAGVSEEEILERYKKGFRVSSLDEIADTDNLFESAKKWLDGKAKKKPASKSSVNEQLKGTGKKEA
jgi:hypothetical protein